MKNFLNHHCTVCSLAVPGPNALLMVWVVSAVFDPVWTQIKKSFKFAFCPTFPCVVQLPNNVRLFANPWTVACQASLPLTISQSLPKFMSIASVMPSSHLSLWCALLLLPSIFPSIRDFSSESAVRIRWAKYWSFQLQHQSFNEYSGFISLRLTGLFSLLSKGLSGVFSSTTVWRHQFFSVLPYLWCSSHNRMWPLGRP